MSEKTNTTVPLRNFRIRREGPQTDTMLSQIPVAGGFYEAEVFGLSSVLYLLCGVGKGGKGGCRQTR
jgi:hypothetical protein